MTEKSQRRERFFPWAFFPAGLAVHPVELSADGAPAVALATNDAHLLELGAEFHAATVHFEIEVPDELIRDAVSAEERASPPLRLHLQWSCPRTRQRGAILASDDPTRVGRHAVELAIRRDDIAGSIHARALLTRSRVGTAQPGLAHEASVQVAASRSWELRVDPRREAPGGKRLQTELISFRDAPSIPKRDKANVYKLMLDTEHPTLFLNADHAALQRALDSRAAVGTEARVRDAVFGEIERAVWARLFLHAAGALVRDGETAYSWQEAVVARLLRHVYADVAESDRRDRLVRDMGDPETVLERLDAALQRMTRIADPLTALVLDARA